MQDPKVKYKLKYPITFLKETFEHLEFRTRVKVGDHRRMREARARSRVEPGTEDAKEIETMALLASLAGVVDEVIDEVDLVDLDGITEAVFGKNYLDEIEKMAPSPSTTKTPS